jgi:1-acyl-sn-glycerol-3-phosphate acyltransferase
MNDRLRITQTELQNAQSLTPAIPAAKNALGDEALYWLFARWSLWNFFDRVWVQTVGPLPHPNRGPFIFYLNHSSWWDGYLMMAIHRQVLYRRFAGYLMMEEKQLRNFRFFAWCGAFSINRRKRDEIVRATAYASRMLRAGPDRALWIFPQGRILHNDQRPLALYPGVARIAQAIEHVTLCPITLRYEFRGKQRGEAFVRLGPAHRLQPGMKEQALLDDIAQRLTSSLDALRDAVIAGDTSNFRVVLRGRPGIDQAFASLLHLLALRRKKQAR